MNQLQMLKKKLIESQEVVAIFTLFLGVLSISFSAIFIKLSESEISSNATAFNRLWIGALALGMWNVTRAISLRLQPEQQPAIAARERIKILGFLLLLGVSFVACLGTWAWSLTQTSTAISTVLHNLTPVFTSLGAWLIFRQQFDGKFLIGMVLAIAGVVTIGIADLQIANGQIEGDLAALTSAIFYAVYILTLERLRTRLQARIILMWSSFIGAVILLPILLIAQDQIFPSSWQGWLAVISLAIICQAVGQGFVAYSIDKLSASFVAVFLVLDPVLTAIEAGIIFSEKLSFLSWMAFGLVMLGIYLTLYSKSIVKQS